jgi:YD repeat-containing protein
MKEAFVTTFTYIPLVGVSSSTDQKENRTSFEYDDYQRLQNVKDRDNNIVKSYKYNYATGNPTPGKYFNKYLSQSIIKGNCAAGFGSSVTYRVPANKYSSTISQADADSKALAEIQANGQSYANAKGFCFYYNIEAEQTFTRNNCQVGVNGSQVRYVVPARKYTSTISQADADAKAGAEITAMGQANANQQGRCGFHNNGKSGFFTKNNCPVGTMPFEMSYHVPASKYYSPTSQAIVDAQEQADIDANGQNYVNSVGLCPEAVTMSFSNSVSESLGISFNRVDGGYQRSYECPPGYSTINLPAGVYTVTAQVIGSIQRRIYVGSRSAVLGTYVTFNNVNVVNGSGSQAEHTMGMY